MAKQRGTAKAVANLATRAPALAPEQTMLVDLIMGARLALQLGISPVTFWRWRKMENFPPGRRIRNHVYFSQAAVLAWLDCQEQTA
jgi:predicted DNA-binding transcriptional regulator AlpA